MACYIYQLPSWVLDDLCRNIDTLSEWDWMQFASYVITDLTQLRKIKSMERVQGVSITRELLWWWAMRQATVQQLVDLLCHLELYRAAQIVQSWTTMAGTQQQDLHQLPCKEDAPCFLKTDQPDSSHSKDCSTSTSVPKQEKLLSLPGDRFFWSETDVIQATEDFDQSHQISEGTFADIYWGQRHGVAFAFKKLREMVSSSPGSMDRFLQAEMQLCLRCCHPNVLPLLGFCTGRQFHSLIYPYMANGSLQDRLQAKGDSDLLPWPQRASICTGLLQAVEYLHSLDIIHSNVKSANVLLDQHLNPKLAHPVAHPCPADKKTKYTVMKTHLFQASAAYLPENFIRVGQLTKQVDIFSCGIVLAEALTGIPAMDKDRSPVYLKDLLLSEIPSSTASLDSRKTAMGKVVAKEICQKHMERRAGLLPEACAEAWASSVCLCLRRRNASLEEARVSMAGVVEQLRGQPSLPWSRVSEGTGLSSNTPEETDDVDNSSLSVSSSVMVASCTRVASSPLSGENGIVQPSASGRVEVDSSSEARTGPQPPQDATETSWKIEINEAKRKLMENILLYKEEKLDSIELFGP
ncbi:interleukin-1 receptor-associated kinase-like 2 isoform X2 [Cricetulus griseus]|uniref:Interleukin-1 receptor-associated kinase-like 2 n=1 Tax=Cricetulus griseus TaxID=10029 RepID=A0A8C2LWC5_CRIGR|nr:interleukin-1 receptor-associated kinase-like 2 isoform X2 [Cricetulus griseus]XP_035304530.1 interleukin-1 receptor-associated kinase-like 2 isoform X2 [Cricetulus griseus]